MLAPRSAVLIIQKFVVASMESKQKYYILHIFYTNFEISIGLLDVCPHFD